MARQIKKIPHRFTIDLSEGLVSELHQQYADFSKNKKRFIEEALREKLDKDRKKKINKLLVEGYQARAHEDSATTKDFEPADLEEIDEY